MSFDKPSTDVFTLQCDGCLDTIEFTEAESVDPANTVECLTAAKKLGWISEKHVGFAWENYCPDCAKLPDSERHPRPK
jgi:hypothetical protein